jgi:hypothetical protein
MNNIHDSNERRSSRLKHAAAAASPKNSQKMYAVSPL